MDAEYIGSMYHYEQGRGWIDDHILKGRGFDMLVRSIMAAAAILGLAGFAVAESTLGALNHSDDALHVAVGTNGLTDDGYVAVYSYDGLRRGALLGYAKVGPGQQTANIRLLHPMRGDVKVYLFEGDAMQPRSAAIDEAKLRMDD